MNVVHSIIEGESNIKKRERDTEREKDKYIIVVRKIKINRESQLEKSN